MKICECCGYFIYKNKFGECLCVNKMCGEYGLAKITKINNEAENEKRNKV